MPAPVQRSSRPSLAPTASSASVGGLVASVALYVSCVCAVFTSAEADLLRALLLLAAVGATFSPLGSPSSHCRRPAACAASGDGRGDGRLPPP